MSAPTNKYPGPCTRCGQTVPAGAGTRTRTADRWTVTHQGDTCPDPADDATPAVASVKFPPTGEQQACIDLFASGATMVIEAGAGAGKTTVLRMIAQSAPDKRFQYVAFNKAIVDDCAGTMPQNVRCNTAHSLAFREVGKRYAHRLGGARQRPAEVAARLGLDPWACKMADDSPPKTLSPAYLAGHVMAAVTRFCQTADERPGKQHFPYVTSIDLTDPVTGKRQYTNNDLLHRDLLPALERAWADLSRLDGALRFGHAHYLKIWALSNPTIDADVILFDEAQDASGVMAGVVFAQETAQVVAVGDPQQEIYGWAGAENSIAKMIDLGHPVRRLSQSFRFGPAVADAANEMLANLPTDMRISGLDSINSTVGPFEDRTPSVVLCRTNAGAMNELLVRLEQGLRPALVGGGGEIASFARGAADLMAGRSTSHPELSCFDTWGSVVAFVEQDAEGAELRLMVNLIDRYGVDTLLRALDRMPREIDADIVISTAHKSKGREWATVLIGSDFGGMDRSDPAEWRLKYVAVTRAKLHLDYSSLQKRDDDPGGKPRDVDALIDSLMGGVPEETPDPEPVPRRGLGDLWAAAHGIEDAS